MASRTGTIKTLKNGKYQAIWTFEDGSHKTKVFTTKTEAREFLTKYKALYGDSNSKDRVLTLNDIFPLYFETRKQKVLLCIIKNSTLLREETTYNNRVKNSKIGNMYLKDLTADLIQNYIYEIAIHHSHSEACKHTFPLISNLLGYAYKKEWLKKPLHTMIEKPSKTINPPKEIIPYTIEQYNKMYAASIEIWDKKHLSYSSLGFFLMCQTGMRTGELLALTLDNIDLNDRMLYVEKSLNEEKNFETKSKKFTVGTTKTKNSIRYIGLNDEALEIIKQIQKRNKERGIKSKYLLSSDDGNFCTPSMLRNAVETMLKYAEVPKVNDLLHSARHYFATRLAEIGISEQDRRMSLGHSSFSTTLNYTHTDTKTQAEKMKSYNINQTVAKDTSRDCFDTDVYMVSEYETDNANNNVINFSDFLNNQNNRRNKKCL